jgi:hypothetical protein
LKIRKLDNGYGCVGATGPRTPVAVDRITRRLQRHLNRRRLAESGDQCNAFLLFILSRERRHQAVFDLIVSGALDLRLNGAFVLVKELARLSLGRLFRLDLTREILGLGQTRALGSIIDQVIIDHFVERFFAQIIQLRGTDTVQNCAIDLLLGDLVIADAGVNRIGRLIRPDARRPKIYGGNSEQYNADCNRPCPAKLVRRNQT